MQTVLLGWVGAILSGLQKVVFTGIEKPKVLGVGGIYIAFGLFCVSCEKFATEDQARLLFEENRRVFFEMRDLLIQNDALKYVSVNDSPEDDRLPRYADFDSEEIDAYKKLLVKMKSLDIDVAQAARRTNGENLDLVMIAFFVYGRGIAGDSESVTIQYWPNIDIFKRYREDREKCLELDVEKWYVCRRR
ncbi:MAG: hypothetical protein AAGC56_09775 [Pseudomonadota bacterium]